MSRLQPQPSVYSRGLKSLYKKKLQISVTGLNWVKTITKKKKKIIGDAYRAVGRLTDRDKEKLQKLVFIFFLQLSWSNFHVVASEIFSSMLFEGTSEGGVHVNKVSKANLMTSPRSSF